MSDRLPTIGVQYQATREDYAAMVVAVQRWPLRRRLGMSAGIMVILLAAGGIGAGSVDGARRFALGLATGQADRWFYAVAAAVLALPWVVHRLVAGAGSLFFGRTALAREPVRITLDGAGITVAATGIGSHILWSRVARVIETPRHLFLVIDSGQTAILPRRAFGSDAAYQAALALAHHAVPGARR